MGSALGVLQAAAALETARAAHDTDRDHGLVHKGVVDQFGSTVTPRLPSLGRRLVVVAAVLSICNVGCDRAASGVPAAEDASLDDTRVEPSPPIVDPCFAAGVRIATPLGERRIESLAVGDQVLAYDVEQNRIVTRSITKTHAHPPTPVIRLATAEGRSLDVTQNHPIYSVGHGDYVDAAELIHGGSILTLQSPFSTRPSTLGGETRSVEPVPVYNLTVADIGNYFAEGVLVHNKQRCGYPGDPPDCSCFADECDDGDQPRPASISPSCPDMLSGSATVRVDGASMPWTFWSSGNPGGAIVIYWPSGFNDGPVEAAAALGEERAWEATLVAVPHATSGLGEPNEAGVWSTGDIRFADRVVACARTVLMADNWEVHVVGYSAGAMQAVQMADLSPLTVASVVTYSGGLLAEDSVRLVPSNLRAAMAVHGAPGSDVWEGNDMATASTRWLEQVRVRRRIAVDCNDGGTHVDPGRFAVAPHVWQFFRDLPKLGGASALPDSFPDYCRILGPQT